MISSFNHVPGRRRLRSESVTCRLATLATTPRFWSNLKTSVSSSGERKSGKGGPRMRLLISASLSRRAMRSCSNDGMKGGGGLGLHRLAWARNENSKGVPVESLLRFLESTLKKIGCNILQQ